MDSLGDSGNLNIGRTGGPAEVDRAQPQTLTRVQQMAARFDAAAAESGPDIAANPAARSDGKKEVHGEARFGGAGTGLAGSASSSSLAGPAGESSGPDSDATAAMVDGVKKESTPPKVAPKPKNWRPKVSPRPTMGATPPPRSDSLNPARPAVPPAKPARSDRLNPAKPAVAPKPTRGATPPPVPPRLPGMVGAEKEASGRSNSLPPGGAGPAAFMRGRSNTVATPSDAGKQLASSYLIARLGKKATLGGVKGSKITGLIKGDLKAAAKRAKVSGNLDWAAGDLLSVSTAVIALSERDGAADRAAAFTKEASMFLSKYGRKIKPEIKQQLQAALAASAPPMEKADAEALKGELSTTLAGLEGRKSIRLGSDGKLEMKARSRMSLRGNSKAKKEAGAKLLSDLRDIQVAGVGVQGMARDLASNKGFYNLLKNNDDLMGEFNDLLLGEYLVTTETDILEFEDKLAETERELETADAEIRSCEEELAEQGGAENAPELADKLAGMVKDRGNVAATVNSCNNKIGQLRDSINRLVDLPTNFLTNVLHDDQDNVLQQFGEGRDYINLLSKQVGDGLTAFQTDARELVGKIAGNPNLTAKLESGIDQVGKEAEDIIADYKSRGENMIQAGVADALGSSERLGTEFKAPDQMRMLKVVGGHPKDITDKLQPGFIEKFQKSVFRKTTLFEGMTVQPLPGSGSLEADVVASNLAMIKQKLEGKVAPDKLDEVASNISTGIADMVTNYSARGTKGIQWMNAANELYGVLNEHGLATV